MLNYINRLLHRLLDNFELTKEERNLKVQKALKEAHEDVELGRTMSTEELDRKFGFTDQELSSSHPTENYPGIRNSSSGEINKFIADDTLDDEADKIIKRLNSKGKGRD